jgi:hypothetical protein
MGFLMWTGVEGVRGIINRSDREKRDTLNEPRLNVGLSCYLTEHAQDDIAIFGCGCIPI